MFDLLNAVRPKVKNAGSQRSVGASFGQNLIKILERPRPAGSNDWNVHVGFDGGAQFDIVTRLRTVAVNAVQNQFARAKFLSAHRPLNGVQTRGFASTVDERFPAPPIFAAFDLHGEHHALRPKMVTGFTNNLRVADRARINADLVRPRKMQTPTILERAHATANGEGHEHGFGNVFRPGHLEVAPV